MSAVHYQDDDRDHTRAMIAWLDRQLPDVWHEVATHLSWDSAVPVLDWIVSQPRCDKATAALILWRANPLYTMRLLATGDWRGERSLHVVTKIVRNWKTGFYTRSELAWSEDHRADYITARRNLGGSDPLAMPFDLLSPWKGREPTIAESVRPENNSELYDLYAALGTDMSRFVRADRRGLSARLERFMVQASANENVSFFGKLAPWLIAAVGLAIAVAAIFRYVGEGVAF